MMHHNQYRSIKYIYIYVCALYYSSREMGIMCVLGEVQLYCTQMEHMVLCVQCVCESHMHEVSYIPDIVPWPLPSAL